MSRSRLYRNSSLAFGIAVALYGNGVFAQDKPATTSLEEIVVTGSLIKGTLEDSAQPIEVISEVELANLGRPSNLDLVKMMSENGASVGEANRFNAFPVGAATINLRNLGSRFTTVVFNNRRFPEQYSAATGRFNNINWIPNAAVGSIQVLKEGGAVTYGADAVGGVVNYLTRKNLDGFEINADYRYIKDSSGDYTTDVSWGTQLDRGNFMVVAGYQHRGTLMALDRSWALPSYFEIKSATTVTWPAFGGSPGAYIFQRVPVGAAAGTAPSAITPAGTAGAGTLYGTPGGTTPAYSADAPLRQISSAGVLRDPNCAVLGGFVGWSATPSPTCYIQTNAFENLVQEQNQYQVYLEYNQKFAETLEFHTEGLYYLQDLPNIANPPSDSFNAGGFPTPVGGAAQTVNGATNGYFVSGRNPAVSQFLSTYRNGDGSLVFGDPNTAGTQANAIVNGGRVALSNSLWRPFGVGGNPSSGRQDEQHNTTRMYRLTAELKGALPEFWGTSLEWSTAVTYSSVDYTVKVWDMLVDRFNAALNGLGGANCTGSTPGANGCLWFNPFSTAIERNVYSGQTNPNFVQSLANSKELVDWMRVQLELTRSYEYIWTDALISGKTGIHLPGGQISAALGVQSRYTSELFELDPLSNRTITPCATIGDLTCTSRTGPLVYGRNTNQLGVTTVPPNRKYPVGAVFTEFQFPLLDSLNFQLAGRYERFYNDVFNDNLANSKKFNDIFVPAGALKWQALDWLAVRVSAGKTFSQVNPPLDDGATLTAATAIASTQFGGAVGYRTASYDNVDVQPMKSQYISGGLIFQMERFTANLDYWYINIDEYTRTMTANSVLAGLVGGAPSGNLPATTLVDCSSPFLTTPQPLLGGNPYIQLASGVTCQPGVTTLGGTTALLRANGTNTSVINFFGATDNTNAGRQISSGIDLSASYRFDDVAGGRFTPSIDATYNTKWYLGDFILNGVTVGRGYDGLGFKNSSTGRVGLAVPEYRGSIGLLYNRGRQTFNMLTTYIPSVINENQSDFAVGPNDYNANIGVNGVVTGASAACLVGGSGLRSDLGSTPTGAGSGEYGSTPAAGGVRGFCSNQNVQVLSGAKIAASYNIDLIYRVELTDNLSMSLTVYNVLDDRPSFDRATIAYNAGFGSPLERNVKLGFKAKF